MIRPLALLLIVTVLTASSAIAAKAKHIELKPKGGGNEIAIVNLGKVRTYHPLSSRRPTTIEVKGPGNLRILTRARFMPNAGGEELVYSIDYKIDGVQGQAFDAEGVVRSGEARYRDPTLGHPGESEDLMLKIGRGYHSIELILRDSLPRVAARFLFAPVKQKKTKWVAMTPLPPLEPVDLYAGEETAHYYRFSAAKPLKIEIIGPTELRVFTRIENSFNMKGRANYRIQIRQNGQVLQSFQLSSLRSETTKYRNNAKLVPGKAREIIFRVPKGRQVYEIVSLEKGTLLGQVMFPQKDAKLGL